MRAELLTHLLAASAARTPDLPAVEWQSESLTYAELARQSDSLAHALAAAGVQPGDRVALLAEKSPLAVIALIAILKAGAAYVPLDAHAPDARLAYILDDCSVRLLLTTEKQRARLAPHWPGPALDLEDPALYANSSGWVAPPKNPDDLAYILYTSGSTGQPKGVMISHRNALTFIHWCQSEFNLQPGERVSSHAPFHFDLSIFDLYVTLGAGATVVLVPPEIAIFPRNLAAWICDYKINVWYSVPSALALLAAHAGLESLPQPALRLVLFAGEVFPIPQLRQLMQAWPGPLYYNLYGPTETNVCTYYRLPATPSETDPPLPIGMACTGFTCQVMDEQAQPAPAGEVGELWVGGPGVALGYWGQPERTAAAFVPDPAGTESARMYRTGDLVRLAPGGHYQFLGRRDHQIKSRGYRIEIGEIEATLLAHPAVLEAIVLPVPDALIGNRLLATLVARTAPPEDLMQFLAQRLPAYMLPQRLEWLESLPKTSTGKVDRQALAARFIGETLTTQPGASAQ